MCGFKPDFGGFFEKHQKKICVNLNQKNTFDFLSGLNLRRIFFRCEKMIRDEF
jgi:hypothetical protein